MATRDSVMFKKIHTDKHPYKATELGGRVVPVFFKHTVVTGEVANDLVNLCVIPANSIVVGFVLKRAALGASAGSGVILAIGDAGDVDRFMVATDSDVAGVVNNPALAGQHFKPTTDTIVQGQWTIATPLVGGVFEGVFWTVPES